MNNYETFKCYNLYKNIDNIKIFLEKINNNKTSFETPQADQEKYYKINCEQELLELIFFHLKYLQLISNIKVK